MTMTKSVLILICAILQLGKGNILLGKPSTHYKGNDGTDQCLLDQKQPVPYWQADLQGYYDIHNMSIVTCFGSYGSQTTSATIEINAYHLECPEKNLFKYGMTPSDASALQTYTFQNSAPFSARFIIVYRLGQTSLGLREVMANGDGPENRKVTKFWRQKNSHVVVTLSVSTTTSANECAKMCHMTNNCLAFSFHPNNNENCVLSDCPSTTDATGWITMVGKLQVVNEKPNC